MGIREGIRSQKSRFPCTLAPHYTTLAQLRVNTEAFFSRLQNRGGQNLEGVEIFPQHAVFIAQHAVFFAQQILDQILRICKSFLKSGFFGHIWFLLFKTNLVIITITNFFAACEECL